MHRRWRTLAAPAGVALCLLATACGGSPKASADGVASAGDGSSARNAADTKSTDPQQAGLDFAKCMRDHGVDMPDPVAGEGGRVMMGSGPGSGELRVNTSGPPAGFEEADAACRHFLQDLIGDGAGPIDPKEQDRALKFAQCMRDNGVDMPDPDFTGGGIRVTIGTPGGGGISPDSEVFQAAQKACGSLFGPAGGGGGSFSSGPVSVAGGRP
jgi:hypothetical protein